MKFILNSATHYKLTHVPMLHTYHKLNSTEKILNVSSISKLIKENSALAYTKNIKIVILSEWKFTTLQTSA